MEFRPTTQILLGSVEKQLVIPSPGVTLGLPCVPQDCSLSPSYQEGRDRRSIVSLDHSLSRDLNLS